MKKILFVLSLCLIPACTNMPTYELTSPSVGSVNIRKVEKQTPPQNEVQFNNAIEKTLKEEPVDPAVLPTTIVTSEDLRAEVDPALIQRIETLHTKYQAMSCPAYHPQVSYK